VARAPLRPLAGKKIGRPPNLFAGGAVAASPVKGKTREALAPVKQYETICSLVRAESALALSPKKSRKSPDAFFPRPGPAPKQAKTAIGFNLVRAVTRFAEPIALAGHIAQEPFRSPLAAFRPSPPSQASLAPGLRWPLFPGSKVQARTFDGREDLDERPAPNASTDRPPGIARPCRRRHSRDQRG
jgi:hypothetical protein